MATIIDKRQKKSSSAGNRRKFINKYKKQLKKQVDAISTKKGLKDFGTNEEVSVTGTNEPTFRHRPNTGVRHIVAPGNDNMRKDDLIEKSTSDGSGGSGRGEDSEGEFTFTLTKQEFLDIFFSDMELPRFVKKDLYGSKQTVMKRAGYSKTGIPPRLNLKKTMEQAIARHIITKKKSPYLDDIDLRYNHFTQENVPQKKAVMICLQDVSGSMTNDKRQIAKKFFLLLYLFLEKNYENVKLHFITYTEHPEEVNEHEFFHSRRTGGTVVSPAIEMCSKIIDEYQQNTTNIYVAHVSDGDNWSQDNEETRAEILKLLPKVQYYVYGCVTSIERIPFADLLDVFRSIDVENCRYGIILDDRDVYPTLRKFFT